MTVQAGQLLRDIAAVGEEHDLLEQAFLIKLEFIEARRLDALHELIAVALLHERCLFAHTGDGFAHDADAIHEILLEIGTLAHAHLDQQRQRLLKRLAHRRPERLGVTDALARLQHARRAEQGFNGKVAFEFQRLGERAHFAGVGGGQCLVDLHPRPLTALGGVQRDAGGKPAAGDALVHLVANLRFQHFKLTRQVDGNLALLAVHGTKLHGDFVAIL